MNCTLHPRYCVRTRQVRQCNGGILLIWWAGWCSWPPCPVPLWFSFGCPQERRGRFLLLLQREGADFPLPSAMGIQESCVGSSILTALYQVSLTPACPVPHLVVATTRMCQSGKGTIKAAGTREENPCKACTSVTTFPENSSWHILSGLQINLMFFFCLMFLTFYPAPAFQVFSLQNQTVFSSRVNKQSNTERISKRWVFIVLRINSLVFVSSSAARNN